MQAFMIMLYMEMCGSPLTIYLLTGFLGVDISLTAYSGYLWAMLLGYGMADAMVEVVVAIVFILPGLTLLIWGQSTVYRARRAGRIVQEGPYRFVHHPQYLGITLAVFGQLMY